MAQESWYALRVRSRFEWRVETMLRHKGYDVFLPSYRSKRRSSNRIKTVELPLFPGDLFCQFDVRTRLPILTTPGVNSVVGIGRIPEPIAEAEIEAIRTVVKSEVAYEPYPYVRVGQMVQVEQGSLCGLTGFVTDVRNESRLIVSVNLLMRSVLVEIDPSWVKPIDIRPRERSFLPASGTMSPALVPFSA